MPTRGPLTGVLLFYGAVVTAALLLLVARWPSKPSGTRSTVEASRSIATLSRLARGIAARAPDTTACLQLTLYPDGPASVRGLLVATQRDAGFEPTGQPETLLALRLDEQRAARPQRSPAEPMQRMVQLSRLDRLSDLVDPDLGHARQPAAWPTRVGLELAISPATGAEVRLQVDNLGHCLEPVTAPGRLDPGHPAGPAPMDDTPWIGARSTTGLGTMDVLARMLRSRICTASQPVSSCRDTVLLIMPAMMPASRADEYLLEIAPLRRLASAAARATPDERATRMRLVLARNPEGGLEAGSLELVPGMRGADDQLTSLFVTRPVGPGQPIDPTAPGLAALHRFPSQSKGRIDVDLATLLRGTAWASPEAVPPAG
jgi:hypothetical protein